MGAALRLPPALPRGGTLGIVAPASPVDPDALERGRAAIHACGFRTVVGEHVSARRGHLAGADADRAADLHVMFRRDDVHAVICARGGAGTARLLPLLDWGLLAAHAKPFIGYSDITALQLALLKRSPHPARREQHLRRARQDHGGARSEAGAAEEAEAEDPEAVAGIGVRNGGNGAVRAATGPSQRATGR